MNTLIIKPEHEHTHAQQENEYWLPICPHVDRSMFRFIGVDVKKKQRLLGHLPPELHHRQIQQNSFLSHRSFKLIPVFVNLHLNTEAGFFLSLQTCPSLWINRNIKLHVRCFTASLVTFYYRNGKISSNVQTTFVPEAQLVVCIIS